MTPKIREQLQQLLYNSAKGTPMEKVVTPTAVNRLVMLLELLDEDEALSEIK